MEKLPAPLEGLRAIKQFIVCKLVPSKSRPGKTDKFPLDLKTRSIINAHDSQYWVSAQEACDAATLFGPEYCVCFVFTENDPYWFIDIDDCMQENGTWNPIAESLCTVFMGCAVEISSSGRGLHIFGQGKPPAHTCKNFIFKIEFYSGGRFVALTGLNMLGNVNFDATHLLPWLVDSYFKPTAISTHVIDWTDDPVDSWRGPSDDDELIQRALQAQSTLAVFNGKASFFDLWTRNEIALARTYPDMAGERSYDESSADAALAQHLAFWTGNNCERMQRLMFKSALVREKWNREDYLPRTIRSACNRQTQWYCEKFTEIIPSPPTVEVPLHAFAREISGTVVLGPSQQLELFKGCIYVLEDHRILIPTGDLLKPEQFRAHYGGYEFVMDQTNSKCSRNAWEVFTESRALKFPRAMGTCFKPDLPQGQIIRRDDRDLVNLWVPIKTPRVQGDPTLFLNHIKLLIPHEGDQQILLAYLAGLVQYPGVKFQWAPVIQGTHGNGKTLFNRCIANAVGFKYSHLPAAAEITGAYNDWLYKTLFIGVDDIYIPHSRRDVIEALKPMITNERLEIHAKYMGKTMRDICCNFILNCNEKEGVPKDKNDRRFVPFYSAQQSKEDLLKDGMTFEYFKKLYGWLDYESGYAIITDYLLTYKIPDEINPANKQFGPVTSSTEEAIEQGLGSVEQQIMEAISQEKPGFKGGFISSNALDNLLKELRLDTKIPINRRRNILQSLGYDWHAALKDGRVNNIVAPDATKPRLFIKNNHVLRSLSTAIEVEKFYTKANS